MIVNESVTILRKVVKYKVISFTIFLPRFPELGFIYSRLSSRYQVKYVKRIKYLVLSLRVLELSDTYFSINRWFRLDLDSGLNGRTRKGRCGVTGKMGRSNPYKQNLVESYSMFSFFVFRTD